MALGLVGIHFASFAQQVPTEALLKAPLPIANEAPWHWQIPVNAPFTIRGAHRLDSQGGAGNTMMYPAASGLMFLAAILTHAAINSASMNAEQTRVQNEADKVLLPYKEVLSRISLTGATQKIAAHWPGLGKQMDQGSTSMSRWALEAEPVYILAQDSRTLTVDVSFVAWDHPRTTTPKAMRLVRVVSTPITDEKPETVWLANDGQRLQSTVEGLLAEALEIVLKDSPVDPGLPHKTVRYTQGSTEQVERGQVLDSACARVLMRNLRGWLLSVPLPDSPENTEARAFPACQDTARRLG